MPDRDIDELIRREAVRVTDGFLEAAAKAHNEAEFRTEAAKVIEAFADLADLDLHLREEYTLVNGRADAVYNRFIIEYEPPGSLKEKNRYKANQHAIGQVKDYMEGLVRRERHRAERLAGVAFDGSRYIFVRRRKDVWHIDDPLEVRPPSTERFLRTLASLSTERALIPENLVEDFGEGSINGRQMVSALYEALMRSDSPKVSVLFEQWSCQFGEVCDYDKASKVNVAGIARSYGIRETKVNPFALFFCIHTYYALLIKILASQVALFYLMPKLGTDLKSVGNRSTQELLTYFRKLEDGALFGELGISNFLEGDFFSWYLDVWDGSVEAAVRRMVNTLADYSLVTLDVDPDTTRDLLKQLYQNLMPKALRHNLGEYYTPDWLAQRLLNQLDGGTFRGDPKKRLLDPACGSGTFLVLAIKGIREYGWKNVVPEADLLEMILENVVGFDLNPLAVISARTNYLLALGDLLQHRRGEITIPVYLCDSILTPSESTDMFEHGMSFNTAVGRFALPSSLVEAHYIDGLAGLLEESVGLRLTPDEFVERATTALPLDAEKDQRDCKLLRDLYAKLLDLDAKGVNGIWARIIKNAFAPLFVGRFDFVAGNPPWVNWEHLPEQYRQDVAPLWQKYNLFTHKGLRARLGSAKDDISVLMFYVAADRYLTPKGLIGFVITQTLFKTEGGGEGFRRFKLGKGGPSLRVMWLDDMSRLKPFEGAANRTAVVIARKGLPMRYPVKVGYWRKRKKGSSLPPSADLSEVTGSICRTSDWEAEPVDDSRIDSPWISGRPKSLAAIKRSIGPSDYRARAGVCTWLNGVYWVEAIATRPDGLVVVSNCDRIGKKKVESIQSAIEAESVFPLLRGQDISRWRAEPSLSILLAQDRDQPAVALSEKTLKGERPRTYGYFLRFESQLRERSGYAKYLEPGGAPFYAVYDIGPYTFAPWKVVWRQMLPDIRAAVVGPPEEHGGGSEVARCVVPQHIVSLVAFESVTEAHYFCGQMNSSIASFCNASYGTGKSYGVPSLLKRLPIGPFDKQDELHATLADASQAAHHAARTGNGQEVHRLESEIDSTVAELWGISRGELKDVQDSLADLMD